MSAGDAASVLIQIRTTAVDIAVLFADIVPAERVEGLSNLLLACIDKTALSSHDRRMMLLGALAVLGQEEFGMAPVWNAQRQLPGF
ncbi:hypothetical protein E4L96_22730 [Massilia arenosa]|uniref:Uncharacterized protein n=1 Tax=Zemynaea arenosa TaxID=2561931 RepID=A0A4Y9RSH4_9BURK|nr:hypothetical protein [Massilia arenosa]TFW10736.1 hypothetical protein E4L96_22730 [Massilia arenosa]